MNDFRLYTFKKVTSCALSELWDTCPLNCTAPVPDTAPGTHTDMQSSAQTRNLSCTIVSMLCDVFFYSCCGMASLETTTAHSPLHLQYVLSRVPSARTDSVLTTGRNSASCFTCHGQLLVDKGTKHVALATLP